MRETSRSDTPLGPDTWSTVRRAARKENTSASEREVITPETGTPGVTGVAPTGVSAWSSASRGADWAMTARSSWVLSASAYSPRDHCEARMP